jgi:acyl-CoA thioester hydrolase
MARRAESGSRMIHHLPIRVYFEDTDAGGIAYHATYLRWAERARTEALREMGLPHNLMMQRHDSILVVRRIEVEYWRPARLDDLVTVQTRTRKLRAAMISLEQRVTLGGAQGDTLLATLEVDLACLDRHSMRPIRIPEPWRTALAPDQGS